MQIKYAVLLAGVAGAVLMAGAAHAADDGAYQGFKAGDIMVRGRAEAVLPTVSSTVSQIGGSVDATKSFIPELDASYFFTPNIAVETIVGITTHHIRDNGSSAGNLDLGHVTLLPATVAAQYHFLPTSQINPYLGAGINYTIFFNESLPAGGTVKKIDYDNNFGAVLQAGADFHLQGNWFANVDVKHVFLSTNVKLNGGAYLADVALDPTIVGVGIGYKF